jgi:hypothetical protein
MILIPLGAQKSVFSCWLDAAPSYLTSSTPTKFNLYFHSTFDSVACELALYKFLIFPVPNPKSIFHRLGYLSKESVQVRGSVWIFVRIYFFFAVRSL